MNRRKLRRGRRVVRVDRVDPNIRDRWHIAGPVHVVRIGPLWFVEVDGHVSLTHRAQATRRDAVRAYWAAARLGRP